MRPTKEAALAPVRPGGGAPAPEEGIPSPGRWVGIQVGAPLLRAKGDRKSMAPEESAYRPVDRNPGEGPLPRAESGWKDTPVECPISGGGHRP